MFFAHIDDTTFACRCFGTPSLISRRNLHLRPKTAAAVKIAGAKVFELLNDASIVRHESSLLKIATTVADEAKLLHKPSTILGWVREFKKLDGFFSRDARGVHEREWILSEEDLKMQLLAWLKNQKRVTTQRVHKYVNEVLLAREGGLLKLGEYNLTLPIAQHDPLVDD